jgi:DNA-binding MarR family transcriptional regulator
MCVPAVFLKSCVLETFCFRRYALTAFSKAGSFGRVQALGEEMAKSKTAGRARRPPVVLDIDHSLFFKILSLVNFTARPFAARYEKKYRIRLTEWRVLFVLAQREALSASDLGDLLGLDKMAISRAVRALEKTRRLRRDPDKDDARRRILRLTNAGRALYDIIAPSGREREDMLLASLDEGQKNSLDALLNTLLKAARALPDNAG